MKLLPVVFLVTGLVAAKGGSKPPPSKPSSNKPPPPPPPASKPLPPPVTSSPVLPPQVTSNRAATSSSKVLSSSSSSVIVSITTSSASVSFSVSSSSITSISSSRSRSSSLSSTKSSSVSSRFSSTSSSATSLATLSYIVYPKKKLTAAQETAIKTSLNKYVKTPAKDIKESKTTGVGVNYWELKLTPADVAIIKKDKNIAAITPSACKGKCFDPTTALMVQKGAEDSVVYWNQKRDSDIANYNGDYYFEEAAGEGVTVYVIDEGAELGRDDFTKGDNIGARARWLFVDPKDTTKTDTHNRWHGTCMLSRVSGHKFGSAKKVNPVIVKIGFAKAPQKWLDGLVKVVEDVRTKKAADANFKAVVSMSFYFPTKQVDQGWIDNFYENLVELDKLGVVLVAASGNDNKNSIAGYPAQFGSTSTIDKEIYIPNLIVVGAVNPRTGEMWQGTLNGQRKSDSGTNFDNAKGLPHIFAPGEQVRCAKGDDGVLHAQDWLVDGTSPATAGVAGLAAYFFSIGNPPRTPREMKQWLTNANTGRAWRQHEGPVLRGIVRSWNGIDAFHKPTTDGALPWTKRSRIERLF
ncbi:subtilisin-like protein [Amniculicola lignicola CBS 123094]|uniref:Subtilisin-like protein n=1 Tax=Amniculicola lignicola CBS 123094 TaxID=1392246 RepID=A0A6A5WYM2_9PLEO|nr:subtilisin-like protein [Amniculicola lignicola CBS 123094]